MGLAPALQVKLFWTLSAFLLFIAVRTILCSIFNQRIKDLARQYITRKTINYMMTFILIFVLIRIWVGGFTGVAAYFGIVSAGLAIALKEPLENIAAWLFISLRKPFIVGDRIQLGEDSGDVIDLRPFSFSVLEIGNWVDADQSTGRIIHIPNGLIFREPLANFTQGFNFIWNEIPITVTFESDWKRAKEILEVIAQSHSAIKSEEAAQQVRRAAQKFLIFFHHLSPIIWTSVADHGVTLTIRYLCAPRNRRSTSTGIWEEVLEAFSKEPKIDFAYPTTRYYNHSTEGKGN